MIKRILFVLKYMLTILFYKTNWARIGFIFLIILFQNSIFAQIISSTDTVKSGNSIQFSHNIINQINQTWYFGDGDSSMLFNPTHLYQISYCGFDSLLVTLVVEDNNHIVNQYNKTIYIKNAAPKPILVDADFFTPFSNCDNSPSISNPSFSLTLNNGTIDTIAIQYYTVNWGDNSMIDTILNSSFPINHLYQSLGLFNLEIKAVSYNYCENTSSYIIANQSNPAIGLSSLGSTQGCAPQEFTFILSQYQSNSPGTYYVWNFGDGSPSITWNYNQPFINDSIKHIFQTTSCQNSLSSFTVSVTAYNFCDQTTATVGNIRIYTKPIALFAANTDTTCVGSIVNFANQTLSGFGYNCNINANYQWNFGDGSTSLQSNSQHIYQNPGIYTIQLMATNGVCGSSIDSSIIVVNEAPFSSAIISQNMGCDSLVVSTQNLSSGGNLKHNWSVFPTTGWAYLNGTNAGSQAPILNFNKVGIYQIKLTETNNCGQDDTIFYIQVMGKPIFTIDSIPSFCASASLNPTIQLDSNYASIQQINWNFNNGNPSFYSGISPKNINYSQPGIYKITCDIKNACGTSFDSVTFSINNLPQVNAISIANEICMNDSISLFASGAIQYNWSNNGNIINTNSQITIKPNLSSQYILVGIDLNSCSNSDTINIKVNPLPNISILAPTNAYCNSDTINLSGIGGISYQWIIDTSIVSSGPNLQTVQNKNITIHLIGEDSNLCKSEDSITIQILKPPTLNIISSKFAICAGDSVQLQVNGATTIKINNSITTPSSNLWLNPIINTVYQINGYDLVGCETDTSFQITVNALPIIIANQSADTICEGDSIFLTAYGATSYNWKDGQNVISTSSNLYIKPIINGYIELIGQDTNGCKNTDSVFYIVNNLPNMILSSSNQNICLGDSFQISASGVINFQWSKNGNNFSNNSTITDTLIQTATFNLEGTDNHGCKTNKTAHVTVKKTPQIHVLNQTNQICLGDSIAINLQGAINYYVNGSQISTGNYLKPLSNSNYQIIGVDSNNCSDTANYSIIVNNLPQTNISSTDTSICYGQSTQLFGQGATTYAWSPNIGLSSIMGQNPVATPVNSITYKVIGTDSNGCKSMDSINIQVNQNLQIQAWSSKQSICLGDSVMIFANGANSYIWSGGNNLLSTIGDTVYAKPNTNTNFFVTGTDTMNCISTTSVYIGVNSPPNIQLNYSNGTICLGDSVVLSANGANNFLWEIANGITQNTNKNGNSITDYPINTSTYYVTGIDSNNCKSTINQTILVNNLPTIQITANKNPICEDETIYLVANGGQSYTWTGNTLNQTGPTLTSIATGSQWIKAKGIGTNGCKNEDSIYIMVNPKPGISTYNNSMAICQGDSANMTVFGNGTINWLPNLSLNQSQGASVLASPASTTQYSATIQDTNGCTNSLSILLTINPLPQADFQIDSLICLNSQTNFVNQSTNTSNFLWYFGDQTQSNSQNPVHAYNQIGFVDIKLIATSNQNCIDSIEKTIHIIDAPQANFTVFPKSGCSPLSLNLSNNSTSYNGTYFWSMSNGQSANTSNPSNFIASTPQGLDTVYSITLSTSNKCGISTKTDTITILSKPVSDFGFSMSSQCSPSIVSFGNISSTNANTFYWDFGDNSFSNQKNPTTHIYTTAINPKDFNISLISINNCGSDTITKILHLNPNIVNAVFTPSSIQSCSPAQINFTNYSNVQTSISWSFGDGNISSQISPSHIYSIPGNYIVTLIVSDLCGTDTAISNIIINASPNITFSMSSDTICQNETLILQNTTANLANLEWSFGDNTSSNLSNPQHSYGQFGQFSIQLIGEDNITHCTDTLSKQVLIHPTAKANISTNKSDGCFPLHINFTNNSQQSNFYQWDFGDGNVSSQIQPQHIYSLPGNYTVQLIADNFYGCSDTTYAIVKSYPHPTSAFSMYNTTPCEIPATIQFTNQSSGATGYQWHFDNLDSSKSTNPTIIFKNPGSFKPQLIAYNSYGCSDTSQSNLYLEEPPKAKFIIDQNKGCENTIIQFINQSTNAITHKWNFGNGNISIYPNPIEKYETEGNYQPYLIVENNVGCTDTSQLIDTIQIFPNPIVNFDWEEIGENQTEKGFYQFENLTLKAQNFEWNFGDNSLSTELHPKHQYLDKGEYQVVLKASNTYGCKEEALKTIKISPLKSLFIPNALSPNHPDANIRYFEPKGKGLATYHLAIYDSWGTLIWETNRIEEGEPTGSWNGNDLNGNPVKQGVYFWLAEAIFEDGTLWKGMTYTDGRTMKNGTVTLIR
jgi:large repetitive protein